METQITTYISFLKSKLLTMLLCTWSQQKLSLNPALDKVQQVWTRLYVDSGAAPEVYHRMSPQSTVKQVMDHVHCVHQVVLEISGCHVSSICKGLLEGETIVSYQWLITLSIIVLHLRFSMLQELQTHCHLSNEAKNLYDWTLHACASWSLTSYLSNACHLKEVLFLCHSASA